MENKAQDSESGQGTAIVLADQRRWMRLPEESAQAYSAFREFLDAGPGQRSIATAYRRLKGMPDGAPVKVPGYINAWAKQYLWNERAAAWDAHVESIAEIASVRDLQAARRQTVEQAEQLQNAIESELQAVQLVIERNRKYRSDPAGVSQTLAELAQALESAARARLMALGADTAELPSHRQD